MKWVSLKTTAIAQKHWIGVTKCIEPWNLGLVKVSPCRLECSTSRQSPSLSQNSPAKSILNKSLQLTENLLQLIIFLELYSCELSLTLWLLLEEKLSSLTGKLENNQKTLRNLILWHWFYLLTSLKSKLFQALMSGLRMVRLALLKCTDLLIKPRFGTASLPAWRSWRTTYSEDFFLLRPPTFADPGAPLKVVNITDNSITETVHRNMASQRDLTEGVFTLALTSKYPMLKGKVHDVEIVNTQEGTSVLITLTPRRDLLFTYTAPWQSDMNNLEELLPQVHQVSMMLLYMETSGGQEN